MVLHYIYIYVQAYVGGGILLYLYSNAVAPYDATITEVTMSNIVTYTCNADGGPGNSYQWIRLRDNEVVSMTQELTLDNTDPLDGGDYQCIVNNNAGYAAVFTSLNGET